MLPLVFNVQVFNHRLNRPCILRQTAMHSQIEIQKEKNQP